MQAQPSRSLRLISVSLQQDCIVHIASLSSPLLAILQLTLFIPYDRTALYLRRYIWRGTKPRTPRMTVGTGRILGTAKGGQQNRPNMTEEPVTPTELTYPPRNTLQHLQVMRGNTPIHRFIRRLVHSLDIHIHLRTTLIPDLWVLQSPHCWYINSRPRYHALLPLWHITPTIHPTRIHRCLLRRYISLSIRATSLIKDPPFYEIPCHRGTTPSILPTPVRRIRMGLKPCLKG